MPPPKDKGALEQAAPPLHESPSSDALNVASRCSAGVTSARPLLLETVAFGALLACGFDEEVRVYKLTEARRLQSFGDDDVGDDCDGVGVGWQWPHWQRLSGGHTAPVRDLQASPESDLRLVSCGMDGRVIVWDYPAGRADIIFEVGRPVLRVLPLLLSNGDSAGADGKLPFFYCLLQGRRGKSQRAVSHPELDHEVAAIPATRKRKAGVRGDCEKLPLRHVLADCLSAGQGGRFVVSANCGFLLVYRTSRKQRFSHYVCDGVRRRVVSVAAHPRERSAAVGLSDGLVLLLHNIFTTGRPVHTQLQWHFRPVSGLAFASDGCALYSGGEEAVLVKWDTSPEAGDRTRAFLPRLGAKVVGLTCGPAGSAAVAVALADNSLLVVDSTLGQAGRLRGLLVGDASEDAGGSSALGLVRDPLTDCVAMSGQSGVLQFYSVSGQRHLGSLDVASANYTAVESAVVAKVTPARVELAAFSDRGAWLATYDRRDDGRYEAEMRLRLWLRRPAAQATKGDKDNAWERLRFSQCGEERLTERLVAMAFQPCAGERKLVCAYADGGLACWTREDRVQHLAQPGRGTVFASHWTVSRTWRLGFSFTGGPLAFDPSGRHLLTCHQSHVCGAAWRTCDLASPPALFRLLDAPASGPASAPASAVRDSGALAFCSMWDDGRSVVLCGRDRMRVWDRESGRVLAEAALAVASAAEDQKSGMLILLCAAERTLLMLHNCEPGQLSRIRLNCPSEPRHLCVTEDTFVFLTGDRRLYVYPEPAATSAMEVADGTEMDTAAVKSAEGAAGGSQAASLLSRILGQHGRQQRDAGEALEERLRLFAESDAFAAPALTRFVAGNLRLVRLRLLAAEGEPGGAASQRTRPGGEAVARRRIARGQSALAVTNDDAMDADEDKDSDAADGKDAEATTATPVDDEGDHLTEAAFERALCRCVRRLSSSGPLPSMRELRRHRRQERRRFRLGAATAAATTAAPLPASKPPVESGDAAVEALSLPTVEETKADGDSESDLIIVSTTAAPLQSPPTAEELAPPRPAKRRANGSLCVDLDEESSSGHSSGQKRRHRKRRGCTPVE